MPELTQTRFGSFEYSEEDVITFSEGLIGFAQCTRFLIISSPSNDSFRWLQSLEEPGLAFLVVDPADFVDGYAVEIADQEAHALGITSETATLLFTTASIPSAKPEDMTINLAGPIVINAETRQGRQLVVDDEAVPVRYAVFSQADQKAA
jgi:flagellar assembly factor FliW